MRVTWVNPSFSDYRVPVYAALSALTRGQLTVIFSAKRVTSAVARKIEDALGEGAIGLQGETAWNLGARADNFANVGLKLPYQPGLARAIAAAKPDVIVSEGFFQWTPASLWCKIKQCSALVIAYERTAHTERNASCLRLGYRRLLARMTDAIACNGSLSKSFCAQSLGMAEERIVTGAMAADTKGLAARYAAVSAESRQALHDGLRLKKPVFLYVGRLLRLKGLRELLNGWAAHERHERNCGSLLLVGDGPERAVLAAMASELGLKHVVFAGAIPYDAIAEYYSLADVLVMPTLEDNWSLVVPEAMACGLPILCSKYNGCWPELVQPGINGWVFDPENAGELADLMRSCAARPEMLPLMGAQSRRIVADYTPDHAARAVLHACEIALNGRHRR